MSDIAKSISQAIKEAKWLSIDYLNQTGGETSYWCAVNDIDRKSRRLIVTAFNIGMVNNETNGILTNIPLHFDKIKTANVLEHTTYKRPKKLIPFIENNLKDLQWLEYDLYNDKILDYLKEAIKYDNVPYQKDTNLVSAIDEDELKRAKKHGFYELSLKQMAELTEKIERIARQDKEKLFQITELAFNLLSIKTTKGLFVCVYKRLMFDPENRQLVIGDETLFNYEFASDKESEFKHNIRNYLDLEVGVFTKLFVDNPHKAKQMLEKSLKRFNESIDDRPYIFDLVRNYNSYIEREFQSIATAKNKDLLSTPLNAFFGNMDTSQLSRKRAFDIVLINQMMNVDQLRVIHNALKQPVTYVQGPPGTGKTHSIINLLISAFFNEQTVLVSSNNNKPIDDIGLKLQNIKYQNRPIPLPFLRLGNNGKIRESLLAIKSNIQKHKHYIVDEEKLSRISLSNKHNLKTINLIIDQYEERLELEESIDALESMLKYLANDLRVNIIVQSELEAKKAKLATLPIYQDEEIHKNVVQANDSFLMWLFYTSVKCIKRLDEPKYKEFVDLLDIEDEYEQVSAFNRYITDLKKLTMLQRVFPIVLTTNQSAWRLGPPTPSFSLTIIDEAGQCSIGYSLFSIIRGERLLLVGDQNQLQPVITISPEVNQMLMNKYKIAKPYHYVESSIIRTMQSVDSVSKFVLLRYHYRCHQDIIAFSNKKYYHSKLIVPQKDDLEKKALFHIQVNQKIFARSNTKNTSLPEIDAIISDIKTNKNGESIGIITPFRNQADLILDRIKKENITGVDVGTVHTFQGDEKDKIYFSAAITRKTTPKAFDWVKNNQELINVATTRAKKQFVMVGDMKEINRRSKASNDIYELIHYLTDKGKEIKLTETSNNQYVNSMNYRQYSTIKEKELLTTVNQILSIQSQFTIEKQVKVSDVLNRFTSPELFDYGTKSVFDFVIYEKIKEDEFPRLVIELDGEEHTTDNQVITRDKMKEKICEDNGIKLIRIPNNYTRRYVFIKDILIRLIKFKS
ncbi:MAG: AAA domain-containing protein [Candidatus Izemoplasmatales bacterium]